jgi:hypothetical protein
VPRGGVDHLHDVPHLHSSRKTWWFSIKVMIYIDGVCTRQYNVVLLQ